MKNKWTNGLTIKICELAKLSKPEKVSVDNSKLRILGLKWLQVALSNKHWQVYEYVRQLIEREVPSKRLNTTKKN